MCKVKIIIISLSWGIARIEQGSEHKVLCLGANKQHLGVYCHRHCSSSPVSPPAVREYLNSASFSVFSRIWLWCGYRTGSDTLGPKVALEFQICRQGKRVPSSAPASASRTVRLWVPAVSRPRAVQTPCAQTSRVSPPGLSTPLKCSDYILGVFWFPRSLTGSPSCVLSCRGTWCPPCYFRCWVPFGPCPQFLSQDKKCGRHGLRTQRVLALWLKECVTTVLLWRVVQITQMCPFLKQPSRLPHDHKRWTCTCSENQQDELLWFSVAPFYCRPGNEAKMHYFTK